MAEKDCQTVQKTQKLAIVDKYNYRMRTYLYAKSILNPRKDIKSKPVGKPQQAIGNAIYDNIYKEDYIDICKTIITYVDEHSRFPNFVKWGKYKLSPALLCYELARIVLSIKKKGKLPKYCNFNTAVFRKIKLTPICDKLSNLTGVQIDTYKGIYAAMEHFSYQFYYEDVKTQSEVFESMAGNCVDLNQVAYIALIEKYGTENVQIVRGVINCSQQYGHVWCRIKIDGSWVNFDASAAAKGYGLGDMICGTIDSITDINPYWAVNDTGDG